MKKTIILTKIISINLILRIDLDGVMIPGLSGNAV